MSITTSNYYVDAHAQADGRKYVREVHVDSTGKEHIINYLASVNADYTSLLNSHKVALESSLAEQEAEELLNG